MNILLNSKKTGLGIKASQIDIHKIRDIKIPDETSYGIPVLNKQGYEKISSNEYIDSFVDSALNAKKPLLEIGSAFGHVVQRVLKAGGQITACDMGEEHLEITIKQTPKEYLKNLHVYPGRFPDEVVFPNESFSAILASRILHFLNGNKIEEGLKKIYNWLSPGGKFYFTALSVYHNSITEGFLPIYQDNVRNGVKWCGEIEDQLRFVPQHSEYAPSFLHVFDIPELEKIITEFGFEIEKISLFHYPNDQSSGDKGHIGFIARKV